MSSLASLAIISLNTIIRLDVVSKSNDSGSISAIFSANKYLSFCCGFIGNLVYPLLAGFDFNNHANKFTHTCV
ncbi:hypothetical protein HanRHA438_Chr15g0700921 [Helianthus annuus]|nr:hypothetical protein HanRHA438_Chr15g0700921 [Helianthus annuus]